MPTSDGIPSARLPTLLAEIVILRSMFERRRPTCPNGECTKRGASVRRHGRRTLRRGLRTRYRCEGCGLAFTAITGTPYERLRHPPDRFDQVIRMTVEGMTVAAIARTARLSESTVRRWQKRGAQQAARFNDTVIRDVEGVELQADELKSFVASKKQVTWIYTAIEVSARLWTSLLVGTRSKRDTRRHFRDVRNRLQLPGRRKFLTSDGAPYFEEQVRRVFGPTCVYAQVEKTYSEGRIRRSRTRLVLGTEAALAEALEESQDSRKINTSFVERLNLTIRRMTAPLHRKTPSFARSRESLRDSLELVRCAYNFLRPHSSLRIGREVRTPAMQAGLTSRCLTFRDVFLSRLPALAPATLRPETVAARQNRSYRRPARSGIQPR